MAEQTNKRLRQNISQQWESFLHQQQQRLNQQPSKKPSFAGREKQHELNYESTRSERTSENQPKKIRKALDQAWKPLLDTIDKLTNEPQPDDSQNPLVAEHRKHIATKESEIKQKDQKIIKMQTNEQALKKEIKTQKDQLAKKQQKIQSLARKLRLCEQKVKLKKTQIQNLKKIHTQIIQLVSQTKAKGFVQYQNQITQKINRFAAARAVEQNLKLAKQKQQFLQQTKRTYCELELTQRDACRMAGISLDKQLPFEQKAKQFYKEIQHFITYQTSFSDSQIIQSQQKQWLLKQVGQCIGEKNLKTRLIFKLDQHNKTNFHKYIDKKYNILILVRLANGSAIGGFCHTPIQKDRVEKHNKGFLFSLGPNQKYQPKSQNQALVSYDDFFLIFGNSEIRIKTLQTKVFSNFGTNSGAFNSHGKKAADFLGGNSNEQLLAHYQIYQISQVA